jgi:hypothetical protein
VGGVLIWSGLRNSSGPDGVVKSYFAALRRSDAPAALSYGDIPSGPHDLLTSTVLAEQQRIAPIHHVGVVSVERHGDRATVNVRYELAYPDGSLQQTAAVPVHRDGGSWRLDAVATSITLSLPQARDRATLLGAHVPTTRTALFPGAVPIRFDTAYLALDPQHSSVRLAPQPTLAVGVEVTAAAKRAIGGALTKSVEACLARPSARSACPLPDSRAVPGTVTGELTGSVQREATYRVSPDPVGRIVVGGHVRFTGSYSALDFSNLPAKRTGEFTLPLKCSVYAVAPAHILWSRG